MISRKIQPDRKGSVSKLISDNEEEELESRGDRWRVQVDSSRRSGSRGVGVWSADVGQPRVLAPFALTQTQVIWISYGSGYRCAELLKFYEARAHARTQRSLACSFSISTDVRITLRIIPLELLIPSFTVKRAQRTLLRDEASSRADRPSWLFQTTRLPPLRSKQTGTINLIDRSVAQRGAHLPRTNFCSTAEFHFESLFPIGYHIYRLSFNDPLAALDFCRDSCQG